ncbi:MAG: molybdopterin-dependent oxidoreductase [Methanobacterium sp.]
MKTIITTCTRDCPGSCSILAQLEGNKVTKLRGNPEHDITAGFLCKNTSHYLENYFYSSKRILNPLLKENGQWKRISWTKALDIAASKILEVINEYDSSAILYYQGFGARTALQAMNKRFFNLLGGVTTTYGTVCGGIGHAALEQDYGVKVPHDPNDQLNSNFIIIWGRNPIITDVHLWRILRKAKRNGTKLVVIDPVKTKTAGYANFYIQPAPGSDSYLAMALIKLILEKDLQDHEFIEKYTHNFNSFKKILNRYTIEFLARKCDVDIKKLNELAKDYAKGKPSSIIVGWGVHRYKQGHLSIHMMDALAAITGNIGVSGGGVTQGFEEYEYFNFSIELNELGKNQRKLPMPLIGEAILASDNPPIKLIFLASGNPINLNPNSIKVKKAFERVDFVIIIDHFLNDSSDSADLFLPATTFLEEEDLMGSYGHNWISPINLVIPPQNGVKSEFEIFQLLARRLGFSEEMSGKPSKWLKELASPILKKGFSLEELQNGPVKLVSASEIPYADKKFKTSSGLFEFIDDFNYNSDGKDELYPLYLLSTSPENWVCSVIPESEMEDGLLEVKIHPQVLKDNNINDGEVVMLESRVGKLKVKVKESEDVRSDFVLAYRGGWMKYGKNINVLTVDMISEKGDCTPYYETRVKLTKI